MNTSKLFYTARAPSMDRN